MMDESKKIVLEDASVLAYLLLKGFKISPFRKNDDGRVAFTVEGGDIEKAINSLYNNEPVGIGSYIQAFKAIKNQIFITKCLSEGKNGKPTT